MHVYVGTGNAAGNQPSSLAFTPANPDKTEKITFTSERPGKLHWGVNSWKLPGSVIWPENTIIWPDNKAVETPMKKTADGRYQLVIGPFTECSPEVTSIEAVMHFDDNTWGKDIAIIFR